MHHWVKILKTDIFDIWRISKFSPHFFYSPKRSLRLLSILLLIILFVFPLAACDEIVIPDDQAPATVSPDNIQVDPFLDKFYAFLGGQEMMGPAISPMVEKDGRYFQYTLNGLMVYDPSSPATEYFKLFPIGKEMGIFEQAVPHPQDTDQLYENGHIIGLPFRELYVNNGRHTYGAPLTEMFYNRLRRRYEQYFEGAAFYQMRDSGEIGMLAYGAYMCGKSCNPPEIGNSVLDYSHPVAPVFVEFVRQVGFRFTGFPIGDFFPWDGKWFQVFQNVVLVADTPEQPQSARLFSVAKDLGVLQEDPAPPSGAEGMNFFSVSDGMGYDIPAYFWDYLLSHGGLQVSGSPVSHLRDYSEGTQRQCFENLCLIYDQQVTNVAQVYTEQLGYQFMGLMSNIEFPLEPTNEPRHSAIILRVEEGQPMVRSDEQQEIRITVLRNGFPVSGVKLDITVTMPDNSTQNFILPETGADGKASLLLPMIQAENGSVILYQVCVINQEQSNFCYEDTFTIWN